MGNETRTWFLRVKFESHNSKIKRKILKFCCLFNSRILLDTFCGVDDECGDVRTAGIVSNKDVTIKFTKLTMPISAHLIPTAPFNLSVPPLASSLNDLELDE